MIDLQVALREHNRRMKMPMQKGLHIASINTAKVRACILPALAPPWFLLLRNHRPPLHLSLMLPTGCHAEQELAAEGRRVGRKLGRGALAFCLSTLYL